MIASVTADGAYDGEPTYAATIARQRHPPPDVIIPPRASAVQSSDNGDSSIRQRATGYGRRNQAEAAIPRCKHLIGPKPRARSLPAHWGEVARRRGAEHDDPHRKARLRPSRLSGAREGSAQPSGHPCNNAQADQFSKIVLMSSSA